MKKSIQRSQQEMFSKDEMLLYADMRIWEKHESQIFLSALLH